jgi:hypothetical protein
MLWKSDSIMPEKYKAMEVLRNKILSSIPAGIMGKGVKQKL